ncbi:hypothetical protein H5410_013913 [Solanum commersonii]|uniref:Uncharacterized protein n=1 Tax=Solanum commersonii TaxID=4109 RepID=A0A9J5ZPJ0_SOLCO|nr:hypothetical protein H5410_013913 [Solanum commersonii]
MVIFLIAILVILQLNCKTKILGQLLFNSSSPFSIPIAAHLISADPSEEPDPAHSKAIETQVFHFVNATHSSDQTERNPATSLSALIHGDRKAAMDEYNSSQYTVLFVFFLNVPVVQQEQFACSSLRLVMSVAMLSFCFLIFIIEFLMVKIMSTTTTKKKPILGLVDLMFSWSFKGCTQQKSLQRHGLNFYFSSKPSNYCLQNARAHLRILKYE